jgi:hypothetical protein
LHLNKRIGRGPLTFQWMKKWTPEVARAVDGAFN